jgi:hypothetical protein
MMTDCNNRGKKLTEKEEKTLKEQRKLYGETIRPHKIEWK